MGDLFLATVYLSSTAIIADVGNLLEKTLSGCIHLRSQWQLIFFFIYLNIIFNCWPHASNLYPVLIMVSTLGHTTLNGHALFTGDWIASDVDAIEDVDILEVYGPEDTTTVQVSSYTFEVCSFPCVHIIHTSMLFNIRGWLGVSLFLYLFIC